MSVLTSYAELGPTNALWRPGGPRLPELAEAKVAISVGPFLHQLMLKHLRIATNALRRFDEEGIWK